ncbi:hypothetical protein [Gimibacter soli]|uniref:Asparagine synthase n=1 Tax=Gimibacter soli TaxID=3024400 RepID=A0AAE9XN19_9PROT|nr:hypothetical protein [Gimibacter soli]WCL53186.1 hypothetical protein PH603_11630 [Gimibacter soli]
MQALPKQFLISAQDLPVPEGWASTAFGPLIVKSAPELPITHFTEAGGRTVGLLLGWAVFAGSVVGNGYFSLPHSVMLDGFLDAACGRFICLFERDGDTFIIGDAGGLLSLVYSPEHKVACSTSTALQRAFPLEAEPEITAQFDLRSRHGWIPFGLTAWKSLYRLLPDHAVRISSWQAERVRDYPAPSENRSDAGAAIAKIAELVADNVNGFLAMGGSAAHITAGRDSRMSLACARPYAGRLTLETIRAPGDGAMIDVLVGQRLAKIAGIKHRAIDLEDASEEEKAAWLERTGYSVNDSVVGLVRTVEKHDQGHPVLTGTGGEVGRAFYWQDGDMAEHTIAPEALVTRLGFTATPVLVQAATQWLNTTPHQTLTQLLDIAYIEQRLGCWAGPSVYGHRIPVPTFSPFNTRDIYRLMLSLPADYRYAQRLCDDLVRHAWPALAGLQYNRAPGLLKLRFLKSELKRLLPASLKSRLKRILSPR